LGPDERRAFAPGDRERERRNAGAVARRWPGVCRRTDDPSVISNLSDTYIMLDFFW